MLLVFTVLFARAILPSAVMVTGDASAATFGLVICSGHGPLFVSYRGDKLLFSSSKTSKTGISGLLDIASHDSETPHHSSSMVDDGVCPFSAALTVACIGLAIVCILREAIETTRSWCFRVERPVVCSAAHFNPPSRAPPVFS
jgi:hypothetical protein